MTALSMIAALHECNATAIMQPRLACQLWVLQGVLEHQLDRLFGTSCLQRAHQVVCMNAVALSAIIVIELVAQPRLGLRQPQDWKAIGALA